MAQAAMASGVARKPITDWGAYRQRLEQTMDPGRGLVRQVIDNAKTDPERVLFPDSYDDRAIKAATALAREKIAIPMLIGKRDQVEAIAHASGLDLEGIEIVDPPAQPSYDECARLYLELMQRRGATRPEAGRRMFSQTRFAVMMLRLGLADCLVMGATQAYAEAMKPALRLIGTQQKPGPDGRRVHSEACGMYVLLTRSRTLLFADTTCQIDFPNLASANIAYKLMHQIGGASTFGPILLGMNRPLHILALNVDSNDIVNLSAYAVVSARQNGG